MKHNFSTKIMSLFVAIVMLMGLIPATSFAYVDPAQRPQNLSNTITIGILNDSRADEDGEFPNEPSETGYTYYYLQSDLSLDDYSWWSDVSYGSNASELINTDDFWNHQDLVSNTAGYNTAAYGISKPHDGGLDVSTDPLFKEKLRNDLNERTIISNWINRKGNRIEDTNPDNYTILWYVLKYETGTGLGYHLDGKIIKNTDVTLAYNANKPEGVTANVYLPPNRSVASGTTVTIEKPNSETLVQGSLIYTFTGWNTMPDGTGTPYSANTQLQLTGDITLYAQWELNNSYSITWLNYDGPLHTDTNIAHGTKIGEPEAYYDGPAPTRAATSHVSYNFIGWTLDPNCTYDNSVGITQDLVYIAQYSETAIAHKATVEVVLNGKFDSEGNRDENSPGDLIDIEDVETSVENELYLLPVDEDNTNDDEYITLTREAEGVYSNSAVGNGDYHIFVRSGSTYTQVGTQMLTIANAGRTRYLPYYSVEYFDGENYDAIATEYYYIGSKVDVRKEVPVRNGLVFTHWNDGENDYNPSTDFLTVNLTNVITDAYVLTAQWVEAATVNVKVVVDHNSRETTEIGEEDKLTIHLTSANEGTGNYNDVANTAVVVESSEWYDEEDVTTYVAGTLYTNLNPNNLYGARASIPGYKYDVSQGTNGIEVYQEGSEYEVTIYLVYDPVGYELPFRVEIDSGTPERMIPKAVDVKVIYWNGTSWQPIAEHENRSVEVEIDNLSGTGSVHVWGFENGDADTPYLYRIEVVRIDLGDYQLPMSDVTAYISYQTDETGFFPEGAYTAIVEVDADLSKDGLNGAHAVIEGGNLVPHGEIVATVSVHPYTVTLNPNGGQWSESNSDTKTIDDRFTVPDLSAYVPTKAGETFDGWFLDDMTTKITSGAYIKNYVETVGDTLELYAKWKPDLTVSGTVVVDLGEYSCSDTTRTVRVVLQMHKSDGTYEVTEFSKSVTLDNVQVGPDNKYATGNYEFTNVPDIGDYRVNVIVTGGGTVNYQNEDESKNANNLYDRTKYNANDFVAELGDDNEAVVNIYMEASTFGLDYMADTSAIAEAFRPTNLALDLRHDHRPEGQDVVYEVIKDDISIADFTDGISDIATVEVPQYHANGYPYDYVISVLNYDIAAMGWDDRHYYHYDTTPGYEPAPFTINYNGPTNYTAPENPGDPDQDVILTATFIPNTYNVSYDLQGGSWINEDQIGPVHHTWGIDTPILYDPVRPGYVFAGWTVSVADAYDSVNRKIPAKIWQDVTFTANWDVDVWKDDPTGDKYNEGDGVPDKYQVAITYSSNNTDYGTVDKNFEIITIPGNLTAGNVTATANAALKPGNHYLINWTLSAAQVHTNTALNYEIVNAAGGTRYDFVANFGIRSGGGGGVTTYTLNYETNGGNKMAKETHNSGKIVKLTKVPKKDGYIFDGWHLDSALTEDINEVKMNKNITVYAAWVEDNGSAGNGYETPGALNGEDHFAYVVGYPDGTVKPNTNITRAEVTSIFFRLLTEEIRNKNLTSDSIFKDINDSDWYNTAISTMAKLGIVNGRHTDRFVPLEFITRAEFAAICARFDDSEFEVVDEFTDVATHWAEAEIHEAAAHGWIRGYEDGTFKPDQFITRAEAMTMINRVLNRVPETKDDLLDNMIKWPDNSDESVWYYLPVQEATNSHDYDMKNHIYEKWTALSEATDWTKYQ